ncbi:MAG: radical SAM protein [Chitinophagaceae bacterium]|nr:MAG: radical SAM protein [Chitinophagaceae bacterium]
MKAKFNDFKNFLRKSSFKKISNVLKIYISYHISKLLRKPLMSGLPFSIAIEPTTSCNLRCPECPSGLRAFTRPTGMLQRDVFDKIIEESKSHAWYLTFYFQGEPYLNPAFLDMVKQADKAGIYTATSTNAHFLNAENAKKTVESGLDRLIISIDGTSQDTYSSYRIGGKLDKVLQGTRNLIYWKKKLKSKKPYVIFQFLVVGPNEHQIEEVKKLGKENGVDEVKFKTAQIYNYQNGHPLIPANEKYSRYRKMPDGTYQLKNKLDNNCWKLWHACVFTWDGRVIPCCFDKDASHTMGNITENNFQTIWKNENYKQFRAKLWKSRSEIDICKNCTEGTKIWTEA